jgi:2-keto-4-pentenoate hydratase
MNFDPANAAALLKQSWDSGVQLVGLPPEFKPQAIDDGYAAQARFVASMGEPVAGWKVAGASPRGIRGELPNAPGIGALVPSRMLSSGSELTFVADRLATIETEVAFRFARAVSPADEAFDIGMLDRAFVTIEVVCSRFVDRKAVGQPSFIADILGFHALICGEQLAFAADSTFDVDSGLWRDGERLSQPLKGDDRTRPLESLGYLWKEFARQGKAIHQGAIVTTGIQSVPVDVGTSGKLTARVGEASVDLTLTFVNKV